MCTLGEKISTLRRKAGYSQEELGFKIGVSRQAVSQWETDALCPKIEKIKALSELFNVSTDYFLRDDTTLAVSSEEFREIDTQKNSTELPHKHSKKMKILISVGIVIIVLVILMTVLLIEMLTYEQVGDETVASIAFGLSQNWIVAILSFIAILIISLIVFIVIYGFKKTKK